MKLYALLAFVGLVSAGSDMFDEKRKIMKWAKMKAMEGCYGEEAMEVLHIKYKKAMKKCMNVPTPELKVVEMMKPYRMVQAMMMGLKGKQQEHMMEMVAAMKAKEEHGNKQQMQTMAFVPYPMMQQQTEKDDEMTMMMKMMKKMMMKKMMKKMMKHHGHMMGMGEDEDMMEDMDEDDMEENPMMRGMDDDEGVDIERFLKEFLRSNRPGRRNRRSSDSELLDLGEELADKLKMQMMKHKAKMGNASCVLQYFGMVDEDNNLDLDGMLRDLDTYNLKDEWLLEKNRKLIRLCYATAESLPREVLNECVDEKWGKIKMFKKCQISSKAKMCMQYDIKKMLEKHFGDLEKLEEETGMEEKMLLPLTKALLDDSF